ncbi:DUF397 domain-containing protein [Streptomyces huiliensis]|uniref:DUF397 domain-containing protein n=1 Tax=Streptomyces huiliensis TaxID=2876027 RepID=UPI001CC1BE4F|nr:DUF397 domain-containing protein [Streptomyces huiliensis]MBZ4322870.1 DUF397 domain-containing protein [Streptomyces huiliensis]
MIWRKSSYSVGDPNECVEVAVDPATHIHIRDSKRTAAPAPTLTTHPAAWAAFLSSLKTGGPLP